MTDAAPATPALAELVGLVLGSSFAAGLNLYATVLIAGLVQLAGWTVLPGALGVLAHPAVLGVAGALFLVEFLADKVPFVDNAWDAVHTFIRPAAAALLAAGAFAGLPDGYKMGAALLAGTVALTSHGAKASTRAAANVSPEPVSNWILSTAEDLLAAGLTWLATAHPYVAAGIVVVLLVAALLLVRTIIRLARRWLFTPLEEDAAAPAAPPPA